jgi:predicted amidophosphoribosyltransferase
MSKAKQMHITDNGSVWHQINACSECFTVVDASDNFCGQCGVEFDDEVAYNSDDLAAPTNQDTKKERNK